ncbi:MAG: oligosaccharide flippase family protein [Clostridia bacterium]|nr:oligosaccharide flippase family protein [Clostridia bacterium]
MRKAQIFIKNFLILTSTSLLINILGLLFNTYITNLVGTECLGLFQLIMSVYMFAITLASSGIGLAATRIVSEELARNNQYHARKAAKKCVIYSFIVGILSCLLIILLSRTIATVWLHGKINYIAICILGASLPFVALSSSINGYFNAIRKASKGALSQIIEQMSKIIISVMLISNFMPQGLTYACMSLVIGVCSSEVFSFLYIFICYLKEMRHEKLDDTFTDNSNISKRILNISVPIAIASYIRSGLSTLKHILIPIRLEKSGVSCDIALSEYGMINGVAMPLILFPSVFINSFSNLLIPEFSRYYATNDNDKIKRIISRIFKTSSIFSICMTFIFFIFSNDICILMYNNEKIATYVKILSPLLFIIYLDTIVDSILKGLNEQLSVMKCNILDLFVSISFIYFLLPVFGAYGYIVVIYISEILNGLISIRKLLQLTNVKFNYILWLLKPFFAGLLTYQSLRLLNIFVYSSLFTLIIRMILFILIYLFYLYLMSCISKKDIKI